MIRGERDASELQRTSESCPHPGAVYTFRFTAHSFYGFKRSTLSMLLFSSNRIWVSLSSALRVDFLWMFILEATIMNEKKRNKSDINAETVRLHNKRFNHFFSCFSRTGFFFSVINLMNAPLNGRTLMFECNSKELFNWLLFFSKASLFLSFIKLFDFVFANKRNRLFASQIVIPLNDESFVQLKKLSLRRSFKTNWIAILLRKVINPWLSVHPSHDLSVLPKKSHYHEADSLLFICDVFCVKIAGWIVADNYWDNSQSQKWRQKAERCRKMPH